MIFLSFLTETQIEKRANNVDIVAPTPKSLDGVVEFSGRKRFVPGVFPLLDSDLLNEDSSANR